MKTLLKLNLILLLLHAVFAPAASTVTNIAQGCAAGHSLFIKSDGSLWAMGENTSGQLGDGTSNWHYGQTNKPEEIVTSNVVAAAVGSDFSLFLKSDGSLWAMRYNFNGQLGDDTNNETNRPEEIVPSGVTAIAAGADYSLFIKSDGSLWGMGDDFVGELGDGNNNSIVNQPEEIVPSGVTAIAAGGQHSLFIKSDGSLWAMGNNLYGELGDCTLNETNRPEEIVPSGVTAIAAGGQAIQGSGYSLFLKSDGSLWAMGDNEYGQFGDGTFNDTNQPEEIIPSGVKAIATGGLHTLIVKSDGSLWATGGNYPGQLGDGSIVSTNQPVEIVASNVVAVAAGAIHSLFIKSDGSLWGMGDDLNGELGDGFHDLNFIGMATPEQIYPPPPPVLAQTVFDSTNLQFTANCLFGGNFYLLASTNLAQPLNQWTPVWTNAIVNRGTNNFSATLTNAINSGSQQFYILQSQ